MKTASTIAAIAGVAAAAVPAYSASSSSSGPVPTGVPSAETCNCYLKLGECQTSPDANQAYCASQFASCANYNPYGTDSTAAYFDNLEKYCSSGNATPTPSAPAYTTATPPSYPSSSSTACPAPGTTGSQGYSCNPAHQYPEGQQCNLSNGCYILTTVSVDVPVYTPAPSACPAPGTTGSQGYSCNPAHQYPEGQQCNLSNGCYILTTVSVDVPVYTPAPSSPVPPKPPVYTNKPSGSVPPVAPSGMPSGSVPPVAPSQTKPITPSSTGAKPPVYTGAAEKVAVGAGALFAGLLAVFAL